jgi:hypothetical protein
MHRVYQHTVSRMLVKELCEDFMKTSVEPMKRSGLP